MSKGLVATLVVFGLLVAAFIIVGLAMLIARKVDDKASAARRKEKADEIARRILLQSEKAELLMWRTFVDAMLTEADLSSSMDVFAMKYRSSLQQAREVLSESRNKELSR